MAYSSNTNIKANENLSKIKENSGKTPVFNVGQLLDDSSERDSELDDVVDIIESKHTTTNSKAFKSNNTHLDNI